MIDFGAFPNDGIFNFTKITHFGFLFQRRFRTKMSIRAHFAVVFNYAVFNITAHFDRYIIADDGIGNKNTSVQAAVFADSGFAFDITARANNGVFTHLYVFVNIYFSRADQTHAVIHQLIGNARSHQIFCQGQFLTAVYAQSLLIVLRIKNQHGFAVAFDNG